MSDNNNSTTTSGGIGVLGLLGVAFVVLKLCGVIHWSWWWVTAPFWAPVLLILGVAGVALVIWGCMRLLESRQDRARRQAGEKLRAYANALKR